MSDDRTRRAPVWREAGGLGDGKAIFIAGPLRIEVDNDDVDKHAVAAGVRQLLRLLNAHWREGPPCEACGSGRHDPRDCPGPYCGWCGWGHRDADCPHKATRREYGEEIP